MPRGRDVLRRPVRVLRVFPDYTADPVWTADGATMVNLDSLAISMRLRERLRAWARDWEALMGMAQARYEIEDELAHATWLAHGERLAAALQAELGDTALVRYEAG